MLTAAEIERLTVFKQTYYLKRYGFTSQEVRRLLFAKLLAHNGFIGS